MDELLSGRTPHSAEAEQAILGAILIDENCVPLVVERLKPSDFYLRQTRTLYECVLALFYEARRVDFVTLLDELRRTGDYDDNTSRIFLQQLMEITPTVANLSLYIDIVLDKSLLRSIAGEADQLSAKVQEGVVSGGELLELAEQRIYALRQGRASRGLEPMSNLVPVLLEHLGRLSELGGQLPGLSTGFGNIDRTLTGLNKSDLIILAARPGQGKTSLGLNIALHVGKTSGKTVAVFSLEMSKLQLGLRMLSAESLVDNKRILTGNLSEDDWGRIAAAAQVLTYSNLLINDDTSVTVSDINAQCRRVENLGLVIIDYLQLMSAPKGKVTENRQNIVADMSRGLKIMSKELNVPVLCLAQLSRANEKDKASIRRPRPSDLRDSGAIEQDADIVILLHRGGEGLDGESENPNKFECIIAKNRHGETTIHNLSWMPQFTTFSEIDSFHEE